MNTQALFCLSLPLVIAGCAQQTSTSTARDSAFAQSLRPPVFSDIYQRSPEVTRSGRYTLVSVKSADAQREPLNQLIDITMPGYRLHNVIYYPKTVNCNGLNPGSLASEAVFCLLLSQNINGQCLADHLIDGGTQCDC